jgi:hypothetical protein
MNTLSFVRNSFAAFVAPKPAARKTHTQPLIGATPVNLGMAACAITARHGVAWVTANGTDHVLRPGQTLRLPALALPAIASCIGGPATVEVAR